MSTLLRCLPFSRHCLQALFACRSFSYQGGMRHVLSSVLLCGCTVLEQLDGFFRLTHMPWDEVYWLDLEILEPNALCEGGIIFLAVKWIFTENAWTFFFSSIQVNNWPNVENSCGDYDVQLWFAFSKVAIELPSFKLQAFLLKFIQVLPKLPYAKRNTEKKGFLVLSQRKLFWDVFWTMYVLKKFWKCPDFFPSLNYFGS